MTPYAAANPFTNKLLQVVRQQSCFATHIVISTQDPTISPQLLDLCSITIVHRFTSPIWFRTLREHLASFQSLSESDQPASERTTTCSVTNMLAEIVDLEPGEALLFSPSAVIGYKESKRPEKLGMDWLKVQIM